MTVSLCVLCVHYIFGLAARATDAVSSPSTKPGSIGYIISFRMHVKKTVRTDAHSAPRQTFNYQKRNYSPTATEFSYICVLCIYPSRNSIHSKQSSKRHRYTLILYTSTTSVCIQTQSCYLSICFPMRCGMVSLEIYLQCVAMHNLVGWLTISGLKTLLCDTYLWPSTEKCSFCK